MFDIRPVNETGDLDWDKIYSVNGNKINAKQNESSDYERAAYAYAQNQEILFFAQQLAQKKELAEMAWRKRLIVVENEEASLRESLHRAEEVRLKEQERIMREQEEVMAQREYARQAELAHETEMVAILKQQKLLKRELLTAEIEKESREPKISFTNKKLKNKVNILPSYNLFSSRGIWDSFNFRKTAFSFALASLVIIVAIGSVSYVSKGFGIKGKVLGVSQDGYDNLNTAMGSIMSRNFDGSSAEFAKAYENFSEASSQLDEMGGLLLDASRFVPFASSLSSGKNVIEAGKHISAAGQSLNEVVKIAASLKENGNGSLLDMFQKTETNVASAQGELKSAQENISKVSVDDLPKDKQQKFLLLKEKLPTIISMFESFTNNSHIFVDLLGGNGPRKYLFLFQNNSEMRATGGFIGSYGLLDISNGKIRNFFIDGIFNPDGQLKERIVPPTPIQKISAAWSLHDSNWFPDFPTSAREAISFYEKTGGPTVDGVITLTPTVMQKLLAITGPIEMPEYDVTLDADNFVEKTQYEVEVDYDKAENKPKKILSDLAPIVLDKIMNANDPVMMAKALQALSDGLTQKHILLYADNKEMESIISQQGWSGEVIPSSKDYLSVINTNINGFKTDGVVQESIKHVAEVQADGSIVDTVSVTRKHNGGNSEFDWWNKVNADYMRIYVPLGSELLDVQGQTREKNIPPLDYEALGFKRDELVQKEEDDTKIDEQTGTRTYEDSGKTVFGNWVYVSPGETVTIVYKYLLPLKLFQVTTEQKTQVDSYSLMAQKQSGSIGSDFSTQVVYPGNYDVKWKKPDIAQQETNEISLSTKLDTDKFLGVVFEKK